MSSRRANGGPVVGQDVLIVDEVRENGSLRLRRLAIRHAESIEVIPQEFFRGYK